MESMESPPYQVFKTILAYSVFILASPITVFFISKWLFFEGIFGASLMTSNIISAVLAVIMLHIAVGMYIYRAYYEAELGEKAEKMKEQ